MSLDISYVNGIEVLVTPVIMAEFMQVNKTVKPLTRYHSIMLNRGITIIKFDQMDVTEIRK